MRAIWRIRQRCTSRRRPRTANGSSRRFWTRSNATRSSAAAAAINVDPDRARKLLPLVATLAMAALGQRLREPSPEIPWFGTGRDDHFDAPLLNALAALFEHDEEPSKKGR
jgi:hypothetical protein